MKNSKRSFPGLPNPDQGKVATHLAKLRSLPSEYYAPREKAFRPVEPDGWFGASEPINSVPAVELPVLSPHVHMA